ncbi:hypothetical protein EAH76_01955 [Sphingomonas glacialis]|uniref:PD-(D/E)XK nuclease-like domain-containing protein n=1 Tax=Sphingomonas glacialis TaxID=658225 RepID=A0A502G3C4_9SPHN|nr:hypothetical protein EAH76_01955 [Sphingomonas glacialis]
MHVHRDTRFRANARLLQALYREEQGIDMGAHTYGDGSTRKLGSRISNKAGEAGRNFMTPEIARLAWREHAYREPGAMIDDERVWTNLLGSDSQTINCIGPLKLDLALATKMLRAMCPDLAEAEVQSVLFEHSPGRGSEDLTRDGTAFDAILNYVSGTGEFGFVALELKYTENGWSRQKELGKRYADLMPASGLFRDPEAVELRKSPLQQFMREHVLAQAAIMRGDYSEGRLVILTPALNSSIRRISARYADHLAEQTEGQAGFGVWTLEAFINALRQHGDAAYADDLYRRYCDWSRVDAEIAAHVPAKLAD